MAKQLNPMPPSAKSARRTLWVQALLAVLVGGGFAAIHKYKNAWEPNLVTAHHPYRIAIGFAVGGVVLFLLTLLMRYQWRWLWLLLVLIEVASLVGLVWVGVLGINWWVVGVAAAVSLFAFAALLGRVARRWFHH
ncbi:MAG TPA: hypothetical protein VE172_22470 [Stackebrandtia sp.]|jgi:hypothetical protein|uniref:hypothetical protein n=1 Tax=Stackebrandtia sp. TaxID=2023065 RepID=UPI002D48476A|nr:hypothetical protein [Stackebrandtia sp.]HZE41574.1 hypothetical protein [Stackebrandtia sp.]